MLFNKFCFYRLIALFFTLIPTFIVACTKPKNFAITENGKPTATIVLAKNAHKDLQWSSKELQKYIQKISGVTVPIVEDGANTEGATINIGKTSTTLPEDYPDTSANPEAYSVKVRDNNIYLLGSFPTSTMFAVFSFIEDQLGVRWFAPGDEWEYVPERKADGTLTVAFESYTMSPYTSPRFWTAHNYGPEWEEWKKKNKIVNSERTLPFRSFQNYIYNVFPPEKYAKTHPEYYPLINGRRIIPTKDDKYWWPCIGNPEVQKITIDFIQNAFNRNPASQSFSLGMDDVYSMCDCELCRKMDGSPDDAKNHNYSNRYYKFVNIIAKEIKKSHPNRYLGTLIYLNTKEVPTDVKKMEDNVFGYMAQDWAKWADPQIKQTDQNNTKAWKAVMPNLARYNYIGFSSIAPRFFPHELSNAMKFDKEVGVQGMYSEISTFLPHSAPMMWAFAKLQWNPDLQIDSLLDEFYLKMFEDANTEVREYFSLLESTWSKKRSDFNRNVFKNPVQESLVMDVEDITKGFILLDKVFQKTSSYSVKHRIGVIKGGLEFYSYFPIEYELSKRIEEDIFAKGNNESGLLEKLGNIMKEREQKWLELSNRNDLLGKNLKGFQKTRDLQADIELIESPIISALLSNYNTVDPNKSTKTDLSTFSSFFPEGGNTHNILSSIESLTNNDKQLTGNSLLKNRSLEKDTTANVKATAENLRNKKSLNTQTSIEKKELPVKNWAYWSRRGLTAFSSVLDPEKQNAVRVNSTQSSDETGTFLQNISSLAPGKKYLAIAWVKVEEGSSSTSSVYLALRFRSKNNWYSKNSQLYKAIASTTNNGWQCIATTITLPNDADGVSFQMSANNASALFSSPELYEIP